MDERHEPSRLELYVKEGSVNREHWQRQHADLAAALMPPEPATAPEAEPEGNGRSVSVAAAGDPAPATERQVAYLRDLGFRVPQDATRTEAAALLEVALQKGE